jgi:hypothetical protein
LKSDGRACSNAAARNFAYGVARLTREFFSRLRKRAASACKKRAELIRVHVRDLGSARATTAATAPSRQRKYGRTIASNHVAVVRFVDARKACMLCPGLVSFGKSGKFVNHARRGGA